MSSKRKKMPAYSPETITQIIEVLQALKKQTQATKTLYFRHNGVVTDVREVPDHPAQLRAAEELMKIMGLYL
jgi:hypothetical protein